ncbi:unnamed protein product [Rhizophagus irregularis]|uniref:Uncharacterized protein n=1 Tax=Rhizophagus irregularis TaxID=588596 RepID=A0A915ZCH4_9GLOM|nr:unnamed protein product [Rhizophagus irregularis]CAB5369206.1 unnamed protein product [Rhizophagus irregularis]
MNEFLSEEIPFNDIPHDEFLAIKISVKDSEDAKDSENGDNSQTNEDGEDGEDSENVNTSDLSDLSFFQFSSDANYIAQSTSDPISECLDCLIK